MMTFTGLDGYCCAKASPESPLGASAIATSKSASLTFPSPRKRVTNMRLARFVVQFTK
jgi:hypothetical protein